METTRKFSRTLEEAFGPYARGTLVEPYEPMHKHDKIVLAFSCVTALVLIVITLAGWLG